MSRRKKSNVQAHIRLYYVCVALCLQICVRVTCGGNAKNHATQLKLARTVLARAHSEQSEYC